MKRLDFYVIVFILNISLIACSYNNGDEVVDIDSEYILFIDNNKVANEVQYIKESQIYKTHELSKEVFIKSGDNHKYYIFTLIDYNEEEKKWIFSKSLEGDNLYNTITAINFDVSMENKELSMFTGEYSVFSKHDKKLFNGVYNQGKLVDFYIDESISSNKDLKAFGGCMEEWFENLSTFLRWVCGTSCGACAWSGGTVLAGCGMCGVCLQDGFAQCHLHL